MKLYLDDVRRGPANGDWVEVRRAEHAIALLDTGLFDTISLDFDLGAGRASGETVLVWLEEKVHLDNTYQMPDIKIHTDNPVGRARMLRILSAIERRRDGDHPNECTEAP